MLFHTVWTWDANSRNESDLSWATSTTSLADEGSERIDADASLPVEISLGPLSTTGYGRAGYFL